MLFSLFYILCPFCLIIRCIVFPRIIVVTLLSIPEISSFKIPSLLPSRGFHIYGGKKKTRKYENDVDTSISHETLESLHQNCKEKLSKLEVHVQSQLSKIAIHRATPKLIDYIDVELENTKKQLKHIARIITNGNFELQVQPFDEANLNPIFCSLTLKLYDFKVRRLDNIISVTVPSLTSEMRKQAENMIKQLLNDSLTTIRIIRQNTTKSLKALEKGLSDDMHFAQKNIIDDNCKNSTNKIEKLCNDKLKQI